MSGRELSLLVSGWRFIPHSFAIVVQFECLEFLRRAPALRLYFEDMPFYNPGWMPVAGMFGAEAEAALRAIPPPPAGLVADGELRYAFPYDLLRPARAHRTAVFGTNEFLTVPPSYVGRGISIGEAQQKNGFSILAPSHWARQGFVRSGVAPECVAVVPHGFDPSVFRPAVPEARARMRAEAGFAPHDFVFVNVGAMFPNKGLQYLLPAFAELIAMRPQVRLVLKGLDSLYASSSLVERAMQALEPAVAQAAASRLTYVGGGLSFQELAGVYQAADCYVSPYLAEGFNMPVLEAAACGLPVICTAGGSTDDFVTDDFALRIASKLRPMAIDDMPGAMGLIPDRKHLLQLMLRAVDDAPFRAAARGAGPAYVGARFTWEKVVDGLLPMILGTGS